MSPMVMLVRLGVLGVGAAALTAPNPLVTFPLAHEIQLVIAGGIGALISYWIFGDTR